MRKQGLACRSLYPNLDWQREIGHELYATVSSTVAQDLVGEWTFAEAAFGAIPEQEESYLQFVSGRSGLARRLAPAKELRAIRTRVAAFVERVAHEVLALAPRAVGCSSTFQQIHVSKHGSKLARCHETINEHCVHDDIGLETLVFHLPEQRET